MVELCRVHAKSSLEHNMMVLLTQFIICEILSVCQTLLIPLATLYNINMFGHQTMFNHT